MMITDETTPLVISIVKEFISMVREAEPKWKKGYLRFVLEENRAEVKASYAQESEVEIVSVFRHSDFFDSMLKKGKELFATLGKEHGLFLLIVDSDLNYEIKFEYDDLNRWRISKLDGGSGVPEGIE